MTTKTTRCTKDAKCATINDWGLSREYPVGVKTLTAGCHAGQLRFVQVDRRRLVWRADLEDWINRGMPTTPVAEADTKPENN